jgi:hypothetical protein
MFFTLLDRKVIEMIPDLIELPYIHLDPAILVVYHSILYHGYVLSSQDSRNFREQYSEGYARKLYIACLRALPAWQREATGSIIDFMAATFMVCLKIVPLDHNPRLTL